MKKERKESKMKKKMIGILGLASVALVGGTFAYFTQTATIDNPFDTASYSSQVTEDFKPEEGEKWNPGAQVNKDVYVDNTGDRPIVVRVKFEDMWKLNGQNDYDHKLDSIATMEVSQGATNSLEDKTDGKVDGDKSVVHKYFAKGTQGANGEAGTWSSLQKDGWYYFLDKVPGVKKDQNGKVTEVSGTGKFLDSVRLDSETDMGKFMTQFYYSKEDTRKLPIKDHIEDGSWVAMGDPKPVTEFDANGKPVTPSVVAGVDDKGNKIDGVKFTGAVTEPVAGAMGYSGANYILRITIETVQATDKAVLSEFFNVDDVSKITDQELQGIYTGWELDKEDLEPETETE